MTFSKTTSSLLFSFAAFFSLNAQNTESVSENFDIKIESGGTFTDGDHAPFWMGNNNYGIGSEKTDNQYLRVGAFGSKKFFDSKLSMTAGADVLTSRNLHSDFYFHQFYADFTYRSLGISIGAKERQNPYKNKLLSSGGMTLSNNARPIPQVEVGFPEYVNVPYTNGVLQVQGGLSVGWFLDNDYKKDYVQDKNYALDALYHRKYAYFKIEKDAPLSFILGLEMDTQWGGKFYKKGIMRDKSPGTLRNFLKVFIPMSGGNDTPGIDQVNVVGNVYGSWHFIFNYKQKDYTIKAYHEHFYEDHSGMFFKNMPDGAYGLEFNLTKKRPISSILIEYVHTKDQSGPFLWDKTPLIPIQVSAGDDYYNHASYISESYHGYVVGNPLLTSPIYNKDKSLTIVNSRISAFHGGFSGYITDDLQYRTLLTYSRSWGRYIVPTKHIRNQFSSMLELTYNSDKCLQGWSFSGALAYDNASTMMVGDNLGFRLKIAKAFNIK